MGTTHHDALSVGGTFGVTGVTTLSDELKTAANLGTAATGFTATEYGHGRHHITSLAVSSAFGSIGAAADLALGVLAYTLPAGAIVVKNAYASVTFQQSDGNVTADTPDWGLGTTVGSGANALLSDVGAAAENIMTGQTAADCDGTENLALVDTHLLIPAANDHTIYLNIADGWAGAETALGVTGTIVFEWVALT